MQHTLLVQLCWVLFLMSTNLFVQFPIAVVKFQKECKRYFRISKLPHLSSDLKNDTC